MLMRTKSSLERALGLDIARGLEEEEFSVYDQTQWDLFQNPLRGSKPLPDGILQVTAKYHLRNLFPLLNPPVPAKNAVRYLFD